MKSVCLMFFALILSVSVLSMANAEVSSASVEKREAEIGGLIKECVGQKNIRPEVTMQLQNPSASSLAQPTVSTLAQPHETLTMSAILDFIKATTNIIAPDKGPKSE